MGAVVSRGQTVRKERARGGEMERGTGRSESPTIAPIYVRSRIGKMHARTFDAPRSLSAACVSLVW